MESAHATTAFRQIYNLPDKTVHGTMLELGWTIAPTLILLMIALPSMALLYSIDEISLLDPFKSKIYYLSQNEDNLEIQNFSKKFYNRFK